MSWPGDPFARRFLRDAAEFEHRRVRLALHLLRVSAVNKQRRRVLQDHREPGRAGESGQPSQPLGVGGHVFVLVLIRARDDEPCKPLLRQFGAQLAHACTRHAKDRPTPRKTENDSQTRVAVSGIAASTSLGVLRSDDAADKRQFPIGMGDVHAVSDDKNVGAGEADEVGANFNDPLAGLLQHRADENPPRAARDQKILGEGQRPARFENVVNEQNVPVADRGFDVAKDLHRPARHGPGHIARQVKELDLRLEPRPMQSAQQVGREHE